MEKVIFDLNNHTRGKYIELKQYTHILAYHACRPVSIQSYLDNGIIPYTKQTAITDAIHKLGSIRSECSIINELEKEWKDSCLGTQRVWLTVNKEIFFQRDSDYYLIYGSEFLNALSERLGCQRQFKKIGIPTIFHCTIPLNDISQEWIDDIEKSINDNDIEDMSICVPKVLAENIVRWEHIGWECGHIRNI